MDENLRKLVHDFRSYHSIIGYALEVLEHKPAQRDQKVFQEMLARNLARSQTILTDLAFSTWQKNAFDGSGELRLELTSLLYSLQTKQRNVVPLPIQDQMDSLITTLLSLGTIGS